MYRGIMTGPEPPLNEPPKPPLNEPPKPPLKPPPKLPLKPPMLPLKPPPKLPLKPPTFPLPGGGFGLGFGFGVGFGLGAGLGIGLGFGAGVLPPTFDWAWPSRAKPASSAIATIQVGKIVFIIGNPQRSEPSIPHL